MHYNGKIQPGELLKAMDRKNWKFSDMLVTEWTRVLCCSGLAQREVGRFRFSFREKPAGFGSVLPDHFSIM